MAIATETTQDLITRIFEMDRAIWSVLPEPEECEFQDAGMHLAPPGTELNKLWRDAAFQLKYEDQEYAFSYSTDGEVKGQIHPKYLIDVQAVLRDYKRAPAMVEISNITECPEAQESWDLLHMLSDK